MRALTVRQPWAACIAIGRKDVENRAMPTRYRGPVAVHAALAWSDRGAADPRVTALYGLRGGPVDATGFVRGQVVAVADLEDCHEAVDCCAPWGGSDRSWGGEGKPGRIFHWLFAGAVMLDRPVPARGRLGLWVPDAGLTAAIVGNLPP